MAYPISPPILVHMYHENPLTINLLFDYAHLIYDNPPPYENI